MKTYINYYFDKDSWIFPENIYIDNRKIKNSGLRIKADSLNQDNVFYWGSYYFQNFTFLGVFLDNKIYRINIETENLLKIIQYSGIDINGFIRGTFRLSRIKGKYYDVYRLIPEDSSEFEVKNEISTIYNNSSNFTSNMIPGHVYISKCGFLYLCLKSDVDSYMSSYWFPNLLERPEKKKILQYISPEVLSIIDKCSSKTFSEFFDKLNSNGELKNIRSNGIYFHSSKYYGKDLGKLFEPDDIIDFITKPEYLSNIDIKLLLIEDIWKKNEEVRKELKSRVNYFIKNYKYTLHNSSDFIRLKNELGIL